MHAYIRTCIPTCMHKDIHYKMTPVGLEPMPFRNGALSHRLRPLGQSVDVVKHASDYTHHNASSPVPNVCPHWLTNCPQPESSSTRHHAKTVPSHVHWEVHTLKTLALHQDREAPRTPHRGVVGGRAVRLPGQATAGVLVGARML